MMRMVKVNRLGEIFGFANGISTLETVVQPIVLICDVSHQNYMMVVIHHLHRR